MAARDVTRALVRQLDTAELLVVASFLRAMAAYGIDVEEALDVLDEEAQRRGVALKLTAVPLDRLP